jgi:electron transfer flavoprotein alpha/beta subunit
MKLLVCFKVTRDLDTVIDKDWLEAKDSSFNIDYTKRIINCYDESALETALFLADDAKQMNIAPVETVALTISGDPIAGILKNLYAVKFDRVVHIQCDRDLRFSPKAVAHTIAAFVEKEGPFDAILTGYQTSIGGNAQTAFLLAEMLHLPSVSKVYDLELSSDGFLAVQLLNAGKRRLEVTAPAIFAFENAKHTYLRTATLREKLAAGACLPDEYPIGEFMPESLQEELFENKVLRMVCEKRKRTCTFISAGTAQEKVTFLFNYIRETAGLS